MWLGICGNCVPVVVMVVVRAVLKMVVVIRSNFLIVSFVVAFVMLVVEVM